MEAMAAVDDLEKRDQYKGISNMLELNCMKFVKITLKTAVDVSNFVTDNCDNFELVVRLLKKWRGLPLELPEAPPNLQNTHQFLCPFCRNTRKEFGGRRCRICTVDPY
jgi:hypothetical protein